jgi:hypothetical protein
LEFRFLESPVLGHSSPANSLEPNFLENFDPAHAEIKIFQSQNYSAKTGPIVAFLFAKANRSLPTELFRRYLPKFIEKRSSRLSIHPWPSAT